MDYEEILEGEGIEHLAQIEEVVELEGMKTHVKWREDAKLDTCNPFQGNAGEVYLITLSSTVNCGMKLLTGEIGMCAGHYHNVVGKRSIFPILLSEDEERKFTPGNQ